MNKHYNQIMAEREFVIEWLEDEGGLNDTIFAVEDGDYLPHYVEGSLHEVPG